MTTTTDGADLSSVLAELVDACSTETPHAASARAAKALEALDLDGRIEIDADGTLLVEVPQAPQAARVIGTILRLALDRQAAEERVTALEERFATNQRLSGVGSYDWHIASDTNLWTDELFRIYGEEPGSFEPSYAEFLARIHPDDRERIQQIHTEAFETRGRYQMHERIVRPDGQVRTLWSNGEVIADADGNPIRMVGVCEDVTERLAAEEQFRKDQAALAVAKAQRTTAMELNDNVVQGLTAASWALEVGAEDKARQAIDRTLAAARAMLDRMLPTTADRIEPGDLVRSQPAPRLLDDEDVER